MRLLITGANGFVGQNLWTTAQASDWSTLALGRRRSPAQNYRLHDLRDPLPDNINFTPDVIVHAAARSSPWGSRKDFIADNVIATKNVLQFARANGHPHVIHVSSAAVLYAQRHQPLMRESDAFASPAINHYAATKQEAENLVREYTGPSTILRPRAVFGPGDTVVFPRVLRAAQSGRLPRIEASEPVWCDLIYIDTLVDYILRVAQSHTTGCYNLTNGEPVRLWELLDRLFRELDIPPPRRCWTVAKAKRIASALEFLHTCFPFLGEPPLTRFGVAVFAYTKTLDATAIQRALGPPKVSLAEGIDRFIHWQRRQT